MIVPNPLGSTNRQFVSRRKGHGYRDDYHYRRCRRRKVVLRGAPEERGKLELLLRLRFRELTLRRVRPLKEIMDEIGADAEAQGLTPEMLESMLRDE